MRGGGGPLHLESVLLQNTTASYLDGNQARRVCGFWAGPAAPALTWFSELALEDLGILLPATAVDFFTLVTGMAGFLLKTTVCCG